MVMSKFLLVSTFLLQHSDYVASALLFVAYFLLAYKLRVGFIMCALAQIVWLICGLHFHLYGMASFGVVFFILNIYGFWNWRKRDKGACFKTDKGEIWIKKKKKSSRKGYDELAYTIDRDMALIYCPHCNFDKKKGGTKFEGELIHPCDPGCCCVLACPKCKRVYSLKEDKKQTIDKSGLLTERKKKSRSKKDGS